MPLTKKRANAPLPGRRSSAVRRQTRALALRPGRIWKSFEQFRIGGQTDLATLADGEIGQLLTRDGNFRILHDADFQHLYGLARDVERVRGGLRVIIAAARSAEQHRDEVTLQALVEAVAVCADFPALPTRVADEKPQPEGLSLDEADLDGIEVDPESVPRPYRTRYDSE